MTQHFILEFKEERIYDDPDLAHMNSSETFRISTRKIAELKDRLYGLDYVQHLIDSALLGSQYTATSRKYSFSDTPSWWVDIVPDADCQDPVRTIEVEIYV